MGGGTEPTASDAEPLTYNDVALGYFGVPYAELDFVSQEKVNQDLIRIWEGDPGSGLVESVAGPVAEFWFGDLRECSGGSRVICGIGIIGIAPIGKATKLFKFLDEGADAAGSGSMIAASKTAGDAARDAIAGGIPGSKIERPFRTDAGRRWVDILTPSGVAIESKVGRTSLSTRTRAQIAKDAELLKTGQVEDVR